MGNVDIAAFDSEYGNGHNLIIHRIFKPSCFNVRARASNRLSFPTSLCTYFESTVLEATNAARDPHTVAVDATNHPFGNPYTNPAIVTVVE